MHRRAGLVVFCRRPAPGVGKQRLARAVGPEVALEVAAGLLDCAKEDAESWPEDLIVSPAEQNDVSWARGLLERPVLVQAQPAGTLGARLNAVDRALRARGFRRLLFIGTDAPSLRPADLLAARDALEDTDVALAPAADGGVTLMAARIAWPDLTTLPWSTSALGAALEQRCRDAGLRVQRLPGSYDVDELEDLQRAHLELARDERPARRRLRATLERVLARPLAAAGPPGERPRA